VYCVSLQLDANHDGIMDLSYGGTDATSQSQPFVFWTDNNYDRLTPDEDDGTNYEDDVKVGDCPYTPNHDTPDCNYRDFFGNRIIPTKRDLRTSRGCGCAVSLPICWRRYRRAARSR